MRRAGVGAAIAAAAWRLRCTTADGVDVPGTPAIQLGVADSRGNASLGKGFVPGAADAVGIEMNIMVCAVFVGLVMVLMTAAIYLTWKRRGQQWRDWEDHATKQQALEKS
ncbi:uncharacterized protein LOC144609362 [Rhinoraja longicauda]